MTKSFSSLVHLDQCVGVSAAQWARHRVGCQQLDLLLTSHTAFEIEALLNGYHIPVHARRIVESGEEDEPDHLSILVSRKQARWAEYILRREGLILTNTIDPNNRKFSPRGESPRGKIRKRWDKGPSRIMSPSTRFFAAFFAPTDPRPEEWTND